MTYLLKSIEEVTNLIDLYTEWLSQQGMVFSISKTQLSIHRRIEIELGAKDWHFVIRFHKPYHNNKSSITHYVSRYVDCLTRPYSYIVPMPSLYDSTYFDKLQDILIKLGEWDV